MARSKRPALDHDPADHARAVASETRLATVMTSLWLATADALRSGDQRSQTLRAVLVKVHREIGAALRECHAGEVLPEVNAQQT